MTDTRDTVGSINRRTFVVSGAIAGALAITRADAAVPAVERGEKRPRTAASRAPDDFPLLDATIDQLQELMRSGKMTARAITEQYIARIGAVDQDGPRVNSVIELNPDALDIADKLDAERQSKGARGPLHGIPVLIKDNIATLDEMQTTAGSLALLGTTPPRDAYIVAGLRDAGAIILGKTNLSEWANFRSTQSTSGWSGRGGQTHNPYALDRTPSGSSSGSAAAAASSFCAVAIGTETDGSIVSPSSCSSLVGVKPTVGLLSRSGIVPISHSQDTPGPICRTVRDAAILLGAMTGVDPLDPATAASHGHSTTDYTTFLNPAALQGAHIGVARAHVFGTDHNVEQAMDVAIDVLRRAGATIVDPADLGNPSDYADAEQQVLLFEFKADLNQYLKDLGPAARVKTLADIIAFNDTHHDAELRFFGQELMLQAQEKGPLTTKAYLDARAKCLRLARTEGIDRVMDREKLDAIVLPTNSPPTPIDLVNGDCSSGGGAGSSTPAAVAGYPSITVPIGYVLGLPVGMSFIGRPYTEGKLLGMAYAYEQAVRIRKPPRFLATADIGPVMRPHLER